MDQQKKQFDEHGASQICCPVRHSDLLGLEKFIREATIGAFLYALAPTLYSSPTRPNQQAWTLRAGALRIFLVLVSSKILQYGYRGLCSYY